MRYLLVGNPNVGKSSVFNLMSETYAHVANYGGITVEKKVGKFLHGELIDLPGTYSVSPNSEDEGVVTFSLLQEKYDGIINVVDSTHLKRNLHLSLQLLELGKPMVMVVNMLDELRESGYQIDLEKLNAKLKCTVVGVSARTKEGINELLNTLKGVHPREGLKIYYGMTIEKAISQIIDLIKNQEDLALCRFIAIQVLEGNEDITKYIDFTDIDKVNLIVNTCEQEIINNKEAFSLKGAIFNYRRDFINNVIQECISAKTDLNKTKLRNKKIDKWLMHPFYGSLIFLLVLFCIYFLTFDLLGTILSDGIDYLLTEKFTPLVKSFLSNIGISDEHFIMGLVIEGIIAGVFGILVFVPQIAILFFLLALVESTGYMARVAMMLDTLLSKFGLNGKSIVPLVTGIGCNVPAIMATRTISDKKERLLTMLIIPFMSCSARIPIYALLASLFFEKYKALIIISMYLIGVVVALLSAKILSLSIFKNTTNQFILEVPPYRLPRAKNVYRITKVMIKDFIAKAGKFILLGTVVLWFLQYVGPNGVAKTQDSSFLAYLGNFFALIFTPLGFGNWQASSSLIVGFLAKELIFSSMMVIYGGEALVHEAFTGLSAFSFMVFSLLYLPCLATVGTIHQETKSLRFTIYSLLFTFGIAYIVCFLIYQVGSFIGYLI
ncbi:MAG TPA: ferrous iron transport protein B [Haloplasmataceae bacterium]